VIKGLNEDTTRKDVKDYEEEVADAAKEGKYPTRKTSSKMAERRNRRLRTRAGRTEGLPVGESVEPSTLSM